jgi:hypothetical protein
VPCLWVAVRHRLAARRVCNCRLLHRAQPCLLRHLLLLLLMLLMLLLLPVGVLRALSCLLLRHLLQQQRLPVQTPVNLVPSRRRCRPRWCVRGRLAVPVLCARHLPLRLRLRLVCAR